MLSLKLSVLACVFLGLVQGATPRDAAIAGPEAVATNAETNYCFARVRGLDPGRLPPAYLVLQLRVQVSYRNAGTRPLILPLERERTVYNSFKPGPMTVFHGPFGLLEPAYTMMKDLPADVSPDSPVSPKNDVFTVIPARGEMTPPLMEEIVMPVNRKSLFGKDTDLRGQRVYLRLKFVHRELSAALKAQLSDRWTRFGVLWTGPLMTNTFVIDIPANPQAAPCKDIYTPAASEAPVEGK